MALVDVYDAMRAKRHYKSPSTHEAAVAAIVAEKGRHFDPDIVDAFIALEQGFRDVWQEMGDSISHEQGA